MARAFISYSHKDEPYRVELDKHLALLKRQGHVELWSDHCIRPGEEFEPAIAQALDAADLVLLLVSADFIHSDYCFGLEMQRAVERHAQGQTVVIPIIVRPCDWMSAPFGRLKALPTDGKAVTKWPSLDDAFVDVVQQMRTLLLGRTDKAANRVTTPPRAQSAVRAPAPSVSLGQPPQMPRSSNLSLPRVFTDEDRHDYVVHCFEYVQNYFERSLAELQARNPGVSGRMTAISARAFSAIIFRDGRRQAGCTIRLGSGFGSDGIMYSGSENVSENSFNEMLCLKTEKHMLHLKATMGMFHGSSDSRLTEEGAAEHLWTMFIGPLQR